MAKTPFQFTLQPEMLSREAERDRTEKEAARLKAEFEREQADLDKRQAALTKTQARIEKEVARQFEPLAEGQPAEIWLARAEFVDELRALEAKQAEAAQEQGRILRLAEHKLRAKRNELAELVARVQALQRASDEQFKHYKAEQEKIAEKKRDEDAMLRWSHQNRKERD
ncbi:MAG: hypothetical protein ACI841_000719 [Planctomycetota bacterium]